MRQTLCDTFRALAAKTHDHLALAESVSHQPLEETLTDINILQLKLRHPNEVYSQLFNKRRESTTGADWEWWLTNASRSAWLGLRVQAKILHLASNTYRHLHYASGKPPASQVSRLISDAAVLGLTPIYCFYLRLSSGDSISPAERCRSLAYAPEHFGCSVAPAAHVMSLQVSGNHCDLSSVLSGSLPWHCLVCCSGYGGSDLPSRAEAFLNRRTPDGESPSIADRRATRRDRPPPHVSAAMDGQASDFGDDPNLRGVVVIAPRSDN
jgi:hypothetical protein